MHKLGHLLDIHFLLVRIRAFGLVGLQVFSCGIQIREGFGDTWHQVAHILTRTDSLPEYQVIGSQGKFLASSVSYSVLYFFIPGQSY